MGFSFRSFFGKGGSGQGTAEAEAPVNTMPPPANMNVPGSPFQVASGDSPFANSLLFKTNGSQGSLGQPVQTAPFNPFTPASAGASAGLTVGDILSGLPSDISKNPDLSPMQAISLPEAVLENVLRSGRGTVPIYELYRACPTLFQMPVSPHDPREVPLPSGRISQLLSAKSHQPAQGAAPANGSPFGFGAHLAAAQHAPETPFGMTQKTPTATIPVEPIYQPSPFSIATSQPDAAIVSSSQAASPFSFPTPPNAPSNPVSQNPFFTAPATPAASPFSFAQVAPVESQAPDVSSFGPPAQRTEPQPQPGFGIGSAPNPFASAEAPQSSSFTESKPDGFFGLKPAAVESAKPESTMFGMPVESKNNPAINASSAFLVESPATPQPPVSAFAPNIAGENNPFLSAPFTEKDSSNPLPPVPAMQPELGKPVQIEKPVIEATSIASPAATTPTNPFARIQALAKAKEAASAPPATFTAPAIKESPAFGAGFLSPEPPSSPAEPEPLLSKPNASIFESLGLPNIGAQAPVAEAAKAIVAPAVTEPEVIKLGLAASLKNCAAADLGTSPEHIPSWVQFSLPVDPIRGQLATGRVTVPFSTILEGIEPEVRGIFAKARPGLMVELAANEVFHALTSNTPPSAEPVAVMPTSHFADVATPAIDPFASLPKTEWKEAPVNKEAESRFWADLPTAAVPSTLFTLAKPDAFSIEKNAPVIPEIVPQEITIEARPDVFIPANQATGIPEFKTVAPLPPRSATVRSEPLGSSNETRRLMLAVLLGTPDVADVGTFASLTRKLPGVSAVLCVQDDRVIATEGDESCEAERFLREAPMKMRMLPSLTALTGIEDTETLHIQSGQGEATFCMQGSIIFAVLHDPHRREPVLKEKITLLGRELAAMLRENTPA